jgi:hypothetical protein
MNSQVAGEGVACHLELWPRRVIALRAKQHRTLPCAATDNNRAGPALLRRCLAMRLICLELRACRLKSGRFPL